ncbi:hypothetical protein CDAR_442731 [Caerostris darwini]|uniref:Uncharacterized protein n=1 Tax=Caerostris darwini TaxID=1538125 RepID=A0AAV4VMG0_9ARAC|nr:hypothetical protein CDAR_442731 [Caerostris darwini]
MAKRSSSNTAFGLPRILNEVFLGERWWRWEISGVRFHCPSVSKQRNTFNDSPESFTQPPPRPYRGKKRTPPSFFTMTQLKLGRTNTELVLRLALMCCHRPQPKRKKKK